MAIYMSMSERSSSDSAKKKDGKERYKSRGQ